MVGDTEDCRGGEGDVRKPWGSSYEVKPLKRVDYDEGYSDGLKEGAQRERRALQAMVRAAWKNQEESHIQYSLCWWRTWVEKRLEKLRAKPLEGK